MYIFFMGCRAFLVTAKIIIVQTDGSIHSCPGGGGRESQRERRRRTKERGGGGGKGEKIEISEYIYI